MRIILLAILLSCPAFGCDADPFEYVPDIHDWPAPVTRTEANIRDTWIVGPRGGVFHYFHGHKVYKHRPKSSLLR